MKRLLRLALACFALAAAPALSAHEFWMLPGSFHVTPGASTTLSLAVGENFSGEPVAFAAELVAQLRHMSRAGSADLRTRTTAGAASPTISVQLARPGTHLFALDTHPSTIELPAGTFNAYLRQEGLHRVLAARERAGATDSPGRERYRRNIKTLLQSGDRGDSTFARSTRQRLEIVPAADPFALALPAPLTLQVLFDARPLPRALVKLWHGSGSALITKEAITDARGRVTLSLARPGAWMASVVHMIPAPPASGVDWDSYWGNLTFAAGAAPAPQAMSTAPRR